MTISRKIDEKIAATFLLLSALSFVLSYYIPWWAAYLIFSAVTGIVHLELIWPHIERYREINEERDKHFPAFRRLDNQHWNKAMFYPQALTIYTSKIILALATFVVCAGGLKVIMFGRDKSKPATGLRQWLNQKYCRFMISRSIGFCHMTYDCKFVDFDYSEYLGPDYLKSQKLPAKASTIVSNHQAWLDSLILIDTPMMPGFAAKVETKKVWILNAMITAVQSLYISRGGSKE
jgi:hypothetical protein